MRWRAGVHHSVATLEDVAMQGEPDLTLRCECRIADAGWLAMVPCVMPDEFRRLARAVVAAPWGRPRRTVSLRQMRARKP